MPELRKDPIVGRWVIISTDRAKRPTDFARENSATLRLAHAIPAAKTPSGFDIEGDRFRAFLFDQAREQLAQLQREAGTNAEVILEGQFVMIAAIHGYASPNKRLTVGIN